MRREAVANREAGGGLLTPLSRKLAAAVAGLGIATVGAGALLAPAQAWPALLVAAFLFLSIALGGAVFLALHHVSRGAWAQPLKRVPEALASWLPIGGAAMALVLIGLPYIYPWASGAAVTDELILGRHGWLNPPFFAARMIGALALWALFGIGLRRGGAPRVALSSIFLVVFALSFSMASFDWLMSVETHWASTIFGMYQISGVLVGGVATTAIVTILLRRRGLLPEVNESHLHDLGKLAFGYSTLWAYLWFSQYLLIWYSNLPEETSFYLARTGGGWGLLFWCNLLLGWVLPFIALLPRPAKRSEANLLKVSLALLLARWLDLYLTVAPARSPEHHGIGLFDVAAALGIGAAFVLVVDSALRSRPLIDVTDPFLAEGLHHHS